MVEAFEETGGNIVAAMQMPAEHISHYGILDCGHSLSISDASQGVGGEAVSGYCPVKLGCDRTLYSVSESTGKPRRFTRGARLRSATHGCHHG